MFFSQTASNRKVQLGYEIRDGGGFKVVTSII